MLRRFVLLFVTCFALQCLGFVQSSGDTPKSPAYQPVVMLTEHDPWLMVIGSDSPSFVLYRNGVVIYVKDRTYRTARLTKDEADALIRRLDLPALQSLNETYSWSEWTDQPNNVLVFPGGEKPKSISIYGNLRRLKPSDERVQPAKLYDALQILLSYDAPDSVEWKPDFLEVMIWPFTYAKGKPAAWPSNWPGLSDPTTVRRKHIISIFIPQSQASQVLDFIEGLKPTQAVLIDGRKWAISTRWPFPHEVEPWQPPK